MMIFRSLEIVIHITCRFHTSPDIKYQKNTTYPSPSDRSLLQKLQLCQLIEQIRFGPL